MIRWPDDPMNPIAAITCDYGFLLPTVALDGDWHCPDAGFSHQPMIR
jgi:hypothetical protein